MMCPFRPPNAVSRFCRHKKWRIIPAIHCLERKCMKGNSRRPFIRKI